mgnify:CR=1 FL=1
MRDIINKLEELNVEKPQQLNEGLGELAHEAEKDHEVQMARSDLYKTAKYAVAIHKMLKDVSEMEGIDGWVQAKITKAADYLGAVKHHMEGEIMQDVELAVVPVAGDMTDAMTMPQESTEEVYEAEERDYICVHAKKGKYECSGTSSYAAAKKAAEHWGLKSTAGIDAHLVDEKKTATESIEITENPAMDLLKKMPGNAATAALKARKASDLEKPERVYQDPLNIDKGTEPYSVNNKYVGKDAIVKMIQDPKTDPIDFDDPEAAIEWEKLHKPVATRAEYDAALEKNKAAIRDAGINYSDALAKATAYYDTKDGKANMQSMGINDEDDLMAYLLKQAGVKDQTPDKYTISSSGDASTKYTSALAALKKNMETESIKEDPELSMMANSRDRVENTYAAILQGVRGRGPAEESEVGDYIPRGMTSAEIMQLIDMLEPQGYDKDFLLKDLAPMMKEDSLQELDKMITKLPPRTSQADRDAAIANAPGVPAGTKGTSLDAWKGGKIPANIANNPSYKSEPGKAWIKQQQAAAKKHFGEGKLEDVDGPVTTHDVKKGDTLYSLAKKHNTTVDRLKQMNRQDDDKIKVGQKLNVPEDADIIGDIIKKLPNTKAGQKTGKDVIGDIIAKLPKDDPRPQPDSAPDSEPKVSAQQQQKIANKAVATPKVLPKAPPKRPERIRSFAQDTTAPLSMMKNWSKN